MKATNLTLGVLLLAAAAAAAEVEISSQNRREVVLLRGGPAQKVRFQGKNFAEVRDIQVIYHEHRIRSFHAQLKPISRNIMDLELQAPADLASGRYRLDFLLPKTHQTIPLLVTVADSAASAAPAARPTPPPQSGWFHP